MKKIIIACVMVFCGVSFGVTNYFTGSVSGNLLVDSNWSLGVVPSSFQDIAFTEGAAVRSSVNSFTTDVRYGKVIVNTNINALAAAGFFMNANSSDIYIMNLIIETNVTKNVGMGTYNGQSWVMPTAGGSWTTTIDHNGSGILYLNNQWAEKENPGNLTITGADMNDVSWSGQSGASTYSGAVILNNITADVYVAPSDASSGPMGVGTLDLENGTVIKLFSSSGLNNSTVDVADGCVLDVSTRTDGAYTFDGVLTGRGALAGDITVSGILRAGPGTGTLTFDNSLTVTENSLVSFEVWSVEQFDVIASGSNDTLVVTEGSEWRFNCSGLELTSNQTFAVLQGWDSISGSSTNVTVTGLAEGLSLDTSALFTTGEVTVNVSVEIGEIDISSESGDVIVSWEGVQGVSYALQYVLSPASNDWGTVTNITPGADGTVFATNTAEYSAAFYRVVSE